MNPNFQLILKQNSILLVKLPAGVTSSAQPLDTSIIFKQLRSCIADQEYRDDDLFNSLKAKLSTIFYGDAIVEDLSRISMKLKKFMLEPKLREWTIEGFKYAGFTNSFDMKMICNGFMIEKFDSKIIEKLNDENKRTVLSNQLITNGFLTDSDLSEYRSNIPAIQRTRNGGTIYNYLRDKKALLKQRVVILTHPKACEKFHPSTMKIVTFGDNCEFILFPALEDCQCGQRPYKFQISNEQKVPFNVKRVNNKKVTSYPLT